jgi:putative phage-type endonuclease
MKVLELEQRSPEWYAVRCGIPTASEFDKIITSSGTQSKQRQKYMYQLAGEKLGGIVDESYQSFAMLQGIEKEDDARSLYELLNEPVQKVGFCLSDCGRWGCSPDGLVGVDGLIEIKCPIMSTHVGYLLEGDEIPTDYFQQTQGQLFVTGRKWVDFVSYFPGLKPLIIREKSNEVFQKVLKKELELFCSELDALVRKLL